MVTTQRLNRCALAVAVLVAASTPALADDMALLDVNSEIVGGLDFQALQNSSLYKSMLAPIVAKQGMQKEIAEFQQTCGIDPQKVITKISFGVRGAGGSSPPDIRLVVHGMTKTKGLACFDKLVKAGKIGTDVKRDGDVLLFKKNNNAAAFTFTDENTALFVIGVDGTKEGIKKVAKGGSALKSSAAFAELYKKTNTGDTFWAIANGSAKIFDSMAALVGKPKAVYGSLGVTKDLNADVRVRMKDANAAGGLATLLNSQAKPAMGMVDKLAITTDNADVRIVVMMTEAKLKALTAMMGGMFGKP
jgi:hypothetical protein